MKNKNGQSKFFNKKIYYSSVAFMALMGASSLSLAMEVDDVEMSRIHCLWNLETKAYRSSALNIMEKKVLNEPSQKNAKLRITFIKKLGEFLKENPGNSFNLEILNPAEESGEAPLSKFFRETLTLIAESRDSEAERAIQSLKLKIFYSRLPQMYTHLTSEHLDILKDEIDVTFTNFLLSGQINENKINYFKIFYPAENSEINKECFATASNLAQQCNDPLLSAKIYFKLALRKQDVNKKIAYLKDAENHHSSKYFLAEQYTNAGQFGDATKIYTSLRNFGKSSKYYSLVNYRLSKIYKTGVRDGNIIIHPSSNKEHEYLLEAAIHGHPEAEYELAIHYLKGGNEYKGVNYLERSANSGHPKAQFELAQFYNDKKNNAHLAFNWYQKAADQKEKEAYYSVGYYYDKFLNNKEESFKYYSLGSDSEDKRCHVPLGKMYLEGRGTQKSELMALQCFQKASGEGSPEGQYFLGLMKLRGQGFPKPTPEDSFYDLKAAADKKHPEALFQCGIMKQFGIGTDQSYVEAEKYYIKAIKRNNISALYHLGWLYKNVFVPQQNDTLNSIAITLKIWEEAAESGHREAAYKAGKLYLNMYKQKKDEEYADKAAYFLNKSCSDNKYPDVNYWLGFIEKGKINPREAMIHYEEAANAGHVLAQYKLGKFYNKTRSIPENTIKDFEIKTFEYFKLAAERGHVKARRALGICYREGIGTSVNPAEAFSCFKTPSDPFPHMKLLAKDGFKGAISWFEAQASSGNPNAQKYFAKILELGIHCKQDIGQAFALYQQAENQGNRSAQRRLDDLKEAHLLEVLNFKILDNTK